MKDIVFVSGHKNPDSDSICSAIAYADYLFRIGRYNAVPVRLGEINKETEYILKRFHTEIPVLLKTVKQTVEDLEYDKVTVFSKELTLKTICPSLVYLAALVRIFKITCLTLV